MVENHHGETPTLLQLHAMSSLGHTVTARVTTTSHSCTMLNLRTTFLTPLAWYGREAATVATLL